MEFIKKLRIFDYLVILVIIFALIVGYATFKGKRATSANQIEASVDIELEVYLRGVTSTDSDPLFKEGDETFITIRNVPYTKLKIKEVKFDNKKALVPSINPKKPYLVVNDETVPNQFDYLVKVADSAKITKDGDAVVGGNKVKIGIPITLEGTKYKLNGVISNVSINPQPTDNIHEDLDKHTQLNQDVH